MLGASNVKSVEKLPLIDAKTPYNVKLSAFYKRSFAYFTVKERLPIILTKVIDHLVRDRDSIVIQYGNNSAEDLKSVIGYISKLKNEIQTNKRLEYIAVDAEDRDEWNSLIDFVEDPYYFTCVWLFTECYVYRRLREAFQLHKSLIDFDPFRDVKDSSFMHSMAAICMAASHFPKLLESPQTAKRGKPPISHLPEFQEIIRMCLWSNKCDLSLSVGAEVTQDSNPVTTVEKFKNNVLVDDSEKIFHDLELFMRDSIGKEVIIDYVCDNSGYELFMDFCFADFLISRLLATHIRFHVKSIPWFVSDATPRDVEWVIDSCINSNFSVEIPNVQGDGIEHINSKMLKTLGQKWKNYLKAGIWSLKADHFWTTPHEFYKMKTIDKDLYNTLSEASLVFFKGDLNYRKLMGEYNWPPTTEFEVALKEFFPCPLVAIRTIKADLISGLPPNVQEQLDATEEKWMETGNYGVIQYCTKRIVLEHEVPIPTESSVALTKPRRGKSKSPGRAQQATSKSPARARATSKSPARARSTSKSPGPKK